VLNSLSSLTNQVTFIPEAVEPICYDVIESVLKDKMYNDVLAPKWIDEICARITKDLVEMNKPFKYMGKRMRATIIPVRCMT
jgi:hypothetical protein